MREKKRYANNIITSFPTVVRSTAHLSAQQLHIYGVHTKGKRNNKYKAATKTTAINSIE